jgi:hypothetical protein
MNLSESPLPLINVAGIGKNEREKVAREKRHREREIRGEREAGVKLVF